jgi:HEAT repeat protein
VSKWNLYAKPLIAIVVAIGSLAGQDRPKDKIKNLEALAKQGKNAVPSIVAYQRDADLTVRYAAVEALIEAGGVESVDALRVSCQDGAAEVQRLAVAGIVNFYKPGYVKKGVRAKITAVNDKITRSANEPLLDAYVVARPEDIAAVRGVLLNGASRDAKLQAAQALATLRAKSALPDLYPLLQSKDDAMMLAALRAIEVAGDKTAASETIFLLRDLNDKIQARAISINGIFRNEAALPDLAEVYARGRSNDSRAAALEAIAMIASPESRGLFEQNVDSRDAKLRGYAAEGLGRIGATESKAKLEELYKSEGNLRARLGQAFALVKLGQLDTAEFSPLTYLFNTLNSAAWDEYAETYLGELCRSDEVRKMLRDKVPTATRAEKIGLARILAVEGKAVDRETVDALAHDRDTAVADEGIKAARALGARLP